MSVYFDSYRLVFACECSFQAREIPKSAGWFYNPTTKRWETNSKARASKLSAYFDHTAEAEMNKSALLPAPKPIDLHPTHPSNMALFDYQKQGIDFAIKRNHSYLAFDQGLGKTPTAIGLINALRLKALIVCPPFLVANWERELGRWLIATPKYTPKIATRPQDVDLDTDIAVLADSLLGRKRIEPLLDARVWGESALLVIDEAHRFKNKDAVRTKMVFEKLLPFFSRVLCLSGTPMPNRPMELYPVLSHLAHNIIGHISEHDFGVRFCGAYRTDYGWNYTGASNLPELNERLKKFMLRFSKAEVLKDLPEKIERIVTLSPTSLANKNEIMKSIRRMEEGLKTKYKSLSALIDNPELGEISAYREKHAQAKTPPSALYIDDILDTTDERLLVLTWHKSTQLLLGRHFLKKLKPAEWSAINGSTPMNERDQIIQKMQSGDGLRMLIAQVQTMVGVNLTRVNRVVLVEYSWAPGDNEQAIDRAHRIGQENTVLVDYLVLGGTLDEYILNRVLEKKRNINQLLKKE